MLESFSGIASAVSAGVCIAREDLEAYALGDRGSFHVLKQLNPLLQGRSGEI